MVSPSGRLGIQSTRGPAQVARSLGTLRSGLCAVAGMWGTPAPQPGNRLMGNPWAVLQESAVELSSPSSPRPVPARPSSCYSCSTPQPSPRSSRSWRRRGAGRACGCAPAASGAALGPRPAAVAARPQPGGAGPARCVGCVVKEVLRLLPPVSGAIGQPCAPSSST